MPLQIPHPNTPLHLYRHLLREATYLPPICRPWTTTRIKERFRDCRHDYERSNKYTKQAHHQLRYLRAANAGHVQRMMKLLYHATGRLGKRKRQLATASLKKGPPADSAALEKDAVPSSYVLEVMRAASPKEDNKAGKSTKSTKSKPSLGDKTVPTSSAMELMQQASSKEDNLAGQGNKSKNKQQVPPTWLEDWDFDMVSALAHAQHETQTGNWPGQMRRTLNPARSIPKEDCWGLPLTLKPKLFTNKLKRFWVPILSKLMPPLPQGEWDALRALTLGEADGRMWKIPSRRPVAVGTGGDNKAVAISNENTLWDWERYATRSVAALERPNARKRKILSGGVDEDPRGQGRPTGVRTFAPRVLRRMYGSVWEASPIMTKQPKGKWQVTWGNSEVKVSGPSTSDLHFFHGVDKKGIPARRSDARSPPPG